jgi:pullulanase/glycogen debranching enzyme
MGRVGHELRAVLGACDEGGALPFRRRGRREIERIELPEFTHQVWHGYLPEVRPGQLYGYRVHGPYEPQAGHRFNPAKLLLDPYALAHKGNIRWHPAVFGYRIGHPRATSAWTGATAPSSCRSAWSWTRPTPGATTCVRDPVEPDDHLRGACQGHDRSATSSTRRSAALSRGWRRTT